MFHFIGILIVMCKSPVESVTVSSFFSSKLNEISQELFRFPQYIPDISPDISNHDPMLWIEIQAKNEMNRLEHSDKNKYSDYS